LDHLVNYFTDLCCAAEHGYYRDGPWAYCCDAGYVKGFIAIFHPFHIQTSNNVSRGKFAFCFKIPPCCLKIFIIFRLFYFNHNNHLMTCGVPAVKFADGCQFPALLGAQFAMSLKIEKCVYCLQVPAQVGELFADGFADCLSPGFLLFGYLQVITPCLLAIGAGLSVQAHVFMIQGIDYLFGFLPGFVQQDRSVG